MSVRLRIPSRSAKLARRLCLALQYSLFVAGALGVGWYAVALAQSNYYHWFQNRALDQAVADRAMLHQSVQNLYPVTVPIPSVPAVSFPKKAEAELVGRLEIPSVHLSAVVLEGVSAPTLRLAAGHIPGTAMPGEPGNVGIAGHRDTFFRRLSKVKKNDDIVVTTETATFRYRVSWLKVVLPDETSVLEFSGEPGLTLVTCYPFYYIGPAPQRYIIRAYEVPPTPKTPTQASLPISNTPVKVETKSVLASPVTTAAYRSYMPEKGLLVPLAHFFADLAIQARTPAPVSQ